MDLVSQAINKRRSIRVYEPKPVPHDLVNAVIAAGNEAPSAMNSQPWRFVVVDDKDAKRKLLVAAAPNAKKIIEQVKDVDPERYESIKSAMPNCRTRSTIPRRQSSSSSAMESMSTIPARWRTRT